MLHALSSRGRGSSATQCIRALSQPPQTVGETGKSLTQHKGRGSMHLLPLSISRAAALLAWTSREGGSQILQYPLSSMHIKSTLSLHQVVGCSPRGAFMPLQCMVGSLSGRQLASSINSIHWSFIRQSQVVPGKDGLPVPFGTSP